MKMILVQLSLVSLLVAQPSPDLLWMRELRANPLAFGFTAVAENAVGEWFLTGFTQDGNWSGTDLVMKLSGAGDSLWSYSLVESFEWAAGVIPHADGGCMVGGSNFQNPLSGNMSLTRLNADGSVARRTVVVGESPASLVQILPAPGGYYLLGNISDEQWMADRVVAARVDSEGNLLWWQEIDQPAGTEVLRGAVVVPDGVVLCGSMDNNMGFSAGAVVHKVLSDGTVAWNRRVRQREQSVFSAGLLPDGRLAILVVDVSHSYTVYRYQLQLVDSEGNLDGFYQVATPSDNSPVTYTYYSMAVADSELILTGIRRDENDIFNLEQVCLVKLALNGDTVWTRLYDLADPYMNELSSLRVSTTVEGAYVIAASVNDMDAPNPNVVVLKTGWDGQVGVLSGTVIDFATQAPLAGAEVEIAEGSARTHTDGSGRFVFSLAPGSYDLIVRQFAYCADTARDVEVALQSETVHDVALVGLHAAVDVTSLSLVWAGQDASTPFELQHRGGPCGLPFEIVEAETWLRVAPEQGELAAGGQQTVEVITVGWLANPPAEYHTTITVRCAALDSVFELPLEVFVAVNAGEPVELPTATGLTAIYPNPFNAQTTITYAVAEAGPVLLRVYDLMGREAARLEDRMLAPGVYRQEFAGSGLSSGIYWVELVVNSTRDLRKVVMIK